MSADDDDLGGLAAAWRDSSGGTTLSRNGAGCQRASAGEPSPVVAGRMAESTSFSAGDGEVDAPGEGATGWVIRAAGNGPPPKAAWPAANDPRIASPRLSRSMTPMSGSAAASVAPAQQPAGERRRGERRHFARRRDDGQPDDWRRDDRRVVERRREARLVPSVTGVASIPIPAVSAPAGDAATVSVFIAARRYDRIAALASGLAREPAVDLVCACPPGVADFHASVSDASPDLLLIDTALLAAVGAQTLAGLRASLVRTRLILLWDEAHPVAVEEIERQGICGCIPLLASAGHCARAICEVSRGGLWLPRWIMNRVCRRVLGRHDSAAAAGSAPASVLPALTAREQAIARRVAAGRTNKEIALELNVSPDTVKKHLGAIFDKIGVHRRSQLAYCLAAGPQPRAE